MISAVVFLFQVSCSIIGFWVALTFGCISCLFHVLLWLTLFWSPEKVKGPDEQICHIVSLKGCCPHAQRSNTECFLSVSIWNLQCWFLVDNMQSRSSINNILAVRLKDSIWPRSFSTSLFHRGSVCYITPIVLTRGAQLLIADQSEVEEGQTECRSQKARYRWLSILTSTSQNNLQPFIWPRRVAGRD